MQAETHFKLKEPKATKPTPVFLISYFGKTRFKYSTGLKINPLFWDFENEKATENKKLPIDQRNENETLNFELVRIRKDFKKIIRDITTDQDTPDHDHIKQKLIEADPQRKPPKPKKSIVHLLDFARQYIDDVKAEKFLTEQQTAKKPGTIQGYITTVYRLKKYEDSRRKKIKFDDVTLEFYNDLIKFLQQLNLSQNSIAATVKNLKLFLKTANKQGLTKNEIHKDPDFKKVESTPTKVFLTVNEIETISKLNLTGSLEKAADLFILACWSGLRLSDIKALKPENINLNTNQISITTNKTGEPVKIPLHPLFLKIFRKYKNNFPPKTNFSTINSEIKEICAMAGIIEPVQITEIRRGLRVDKFLPKNQLVSFHTARRSFASNLYLAGIPAISIMKLTGHRTESSFLKYIRIDSDQNAELIAKNPLFSHLKIAK